MLSTHDKEAMKLAKRLLVAVVQENPNMIARNCDATFDNIFKASANFVNRGHEYFQKKHVKEHL